LALVVDMQDRVTALMDAHEARFHWCEADNVYGVFDHAEKALRCSLDIQRETARVNAGRPAPSRLAVCIGIGSGKLLRIGNENLYGDEMNLASKLGEDTAGPGEILMTENAWGEVGGRISGIQVEERTVREGGVDISHFSIMQIGDRKGG
jgi:class 3 adenylate cyclase